MKIERIVASITAKINAAQFETLELFSSASGFVEEGESSAAALDELFSICADGLTQKMKPLTSSHPSAYERWMRILAIAPREVMIETTDEGENENERAL